MNKFRAGFTYAFVVSYGSFIHLDSEEILSLSLDVVLRLFDEDNEEILFETEGDVVEASEPHLFLSNGEKVNLSDLFICVLDEDELFDFEPNMDLMRQLNIYGASVEIKEYAKDVVQTEVDDETQSLLDMLSDITGNKIPVADPIVIDEVTFKSILKDNWDLFQCSSKHTVAQVLSYFCEEVDENTVEVMFDGSDD